MTPVAPNASAIRKRALRAAPRRNTPARSVRKPQGPKSFLYMASKPGGGRTYGFRSAQTERALAAQLRAERSVLLRAWPLPISTGPEAGLNLKDEVALNEQLSQLLARGVPLVEALEVAASVVGSKKAPRINRMRELVAAGSNFADAAQNAGGFDRVTTAVYRAAERSGDLAGAAEQIARNAKRQLETKGKAVTLMIYPIIVATIGIAAGAVLLTLVVPQIAESLTGAGLELPWYSQIVIDSGTFLRSNALAVGIGVLVALVVGVIGRRAIGAVLAPVARRIPLLKDVLLMQETVRFFTVMAAMTRSGVPLADALGVSVDAVHHPVLRMELDRLRTRLVQGGILGRLLDEVKSLPLATRRLLIAADRAGDLESAFDSLADDLAKNLDTLTGRLLAALEPILIVILFLFIGAILISVIIPMVTLTAQAI